MTEPTVIATGLEFPEGPVALSDGSIVLTEIKRGTITWLTAEGDVRNRFDVGGGPNGAAIGPDGKLYITNNGGSFTWNDVMGLTVPGPCPDTHQGGSIQRLDLDTGEVETLFTESQAADGSTVPLRGPNDLVFDADGGCWFTDHGTRTHRHADITGLHYIAPGATSCREVIHPIDSPNGVGLSPDGTQLYAAETHTGRVWRWALSGPGELDAEQANPIGAGGGHLLLGAEGHQLFDSLAVDGEGYVCVATLINGGITAIAPDGGDIEHHPFADLLVTNICFGGDDLRTAYVTLSGTGQLVSVPWPRAGLELAYNR